jgi:ABC-type nitrate/sulfonate/bicarbonate transport system substrate-binding protein
MSQKTRYTVFILAIVLIVGLTLYRALTTVPTGKPNIRVVHTVGYCNAALFVAAAESVQNPRAANIETEFVANPSEHAAALQSPNGPLASVTPFTNALVAYGNGMDIRIIAGCGQNGLALVGDKAYEGPDSLVGRRIGTVPGDTLEQLAYDFAKQNSIDKDVEFLSFTDPIKLIQALKNGDVGAITHVEPFVTQLVEQDGMKLITRGEEFWGQSHPDCVLVTTASALRSRRDELSSLIRMLFDAESKIRLKPKEMVALVAEPMYQMKPDQLLFAIKSQSPKIDIRDSEPFMIKRYQALRELGYIKESAPTVSTAFDFSILETVAAEKK